MISLTEVAMEGRPEEALAEVWLDSSAITMAFLNIPLEDYSEELEGELLAMFRERSCCRGE